MHLFRFPRSSRDRLRLCLLHSALAPLRADMRRVTLAILFNARNMKTLASLSSSIRNDGYVNKPFTILNPNTKKNLLQHMSKTDEIFRTKTCNICVKYMQRPDKNTCNICLKNR
jgi:hypothetical protein